MTQDVLSNLIPRIESKFKAMFYITDEQGRIILNEEGKMFGLPVLQNDFTLKFKYSTPQEWVNELLSVGQSNAKKRYPFLYANSMTVNQTVNTNIETVTIGEIVLAVNSTIKWTSAQRDTYSFKPILNNLYTLFYEALNVSRECVVIDRGTRKDHYFYGKSGLYGGTENKFSDFVDAIEINNLKLRILKNC
jgi:hypothetical protein